VAELAPGAQAWQLEAGAQLELSPLTPFGTESMGFGGRSTARQCQQMGAPKACMCMHACLGLRAVHERMIMLFVVCTMPY
jgi:hypothetical protein